MVSIHSGLKCLVVFSLSVLAFSASASASQKCLDAAKSAVAMSIQIDEGLASVVSANLLEQRGSKELIKVVSRYRLTQNVFHTVLAGVEKNVCRIYGMQLDHQAIDLSVAPDYGPIGESSNFTGLCASKAKHLIESIEEQNGYDAVDLVSIHAPDFERTWFLRSAPISYVSAKLTDGSDVSLQKYTVHFSNWIENGCTVNGLLRQGETNSLNLSYDPYFVLEAEIRKAAANYGKGRDNNYVLIDIVSEVTHPDNEHPAINWGADQEIDVDTGSFSEIKSAISECALMGRGAYGEHLSRSKQKRLAGALTAKIYELMDNRELVNIQKLMGYNNTYDLINSPCALKFTLNFNTAIVMSSHSFD